MLGSTKYYFAIPAHTGVVEIVNHNVDEDGTSYAPNDADLQTVRQAMEKMLQAGFSFTTEGLKVTVEAETLQYAVKPLQANKRIHP